MITLDTILAEFHSIQIKDAAGDALAISAGGAALIEAVDLDIRDLAFSTDKVDVTGSEVSLDSATLAALENITATISGDVNVTQGTSPWVVSGTVELGATTLAALETITVTATDLDIRDLTHVSDSVKIGDGTDFLAINADGSINAAFTEGGYSSWSVVKDTVTNTAAQLVASPLSNRLRIEIQNLGSSDIFIKQNNTAVLDGLKIPKGSSYEQTLDAGAAVYAITASGSSDVRIAQYAA